MKKYHHLRAATATTTAIIRAKTFNHRCMAIALRRGTRKPTITHPGLFAVDFLVEIVIYDISAGSNEHSSEHHKVENPVGEHHFYAVVGEHGEYHKQTHYNHSQNDYKDIFPPYQFQKVFHNAKIQIYFRFTRYDFRLFEIV